MNHSVPILTSSGGYGHISATIALEEALSTFGIQTNRVFALTDIIGSCDATAQLSGRRLCSEDLYNILLKRRHYTAINGIVSIGLAYYAWKRRRMDILCTEYVEREMPQAIISVAPLINGSMARACAAAGIPFYIIPTDLDMRLFVDNLSPDACSTTTILLPFEHQELITQVPHYASWVVNGPVVRSSFFTTYDRAKVREELGIDPNKKMIVAMLGGQGVASASDIVHALSNQNTPCTIATINAPPGTIPSERPHTTITEFSFRTDIARFIKVADLVVTKGGSMSVLEALVSQTPLLLDGTHGMLRWEKFNYRFIEESGYGKQATTLNALSRATEQILSDTFFYEKTPKDLSIDGARALAEKISEKVTQNKAQALSHLQEL